MSDTPQRIAPKSARQSAGFFGSVPVQKDTRHAEEAPVRKEPEPVEEDEQEEEVSAQEPETEEPEDVDVDEPEDAPDTSDTYVVRVDGEEVEVTLDELLGGYSRTSDYTRKTQALSREKKQFEQERQQSLQIAEALNSRLQEVENLMSQFAQEPDWAKLSQELDPKQYNQARAMYDSQRKQLGSIQQQRQELQRLQQAEIDRQIQMAEQQLPELIPEWGDAATAQREAQDIYEWATGEMGFAQEALDQLYDPKAVRVLRDAWRYSQLQKQKPQIVRKKAPKTASAGAGVKTKSNRQKQAERALKGPVKVKQAADFFANIKPQR